MKISVFGMGYVGCVSAACLADAGHQVIGVDPVAKKVDQINRGESPVSETKLPEMLRIAVDSGKLKATQDHKRAIAETELSLIAVGTPSEPDGSLMVRYLESVTRQIGEALQGSTKPHILVYRSTMLPGTLNNIIKPLLAESSGRTPENGVDLCNNPEFLREGSSVDDFFNPPFTLIGADRTETFQQVARLYLGVNGPTHHTSIATAESVKYMCNAFHALKIAFANETAAVLHKAGADPRQAVELFLQDDKLNISTAYLRPGFAFGGSCLPKDLRALSAVADKGGVDVPLINGILASNQAHMERAIEAVLASGAKRVALSGLSFKPGTDDLRESPSIPLANRLVEAGVELSIYDPRVRMEQLVGANLAFLKKKMPDLSERLTDDPAKALLGAELVVMAHADAAMRQQLFAMPGPVKLLDLAGYADLAQKSNIEYQGLCWE
ncbi:MAG: nucleotide sugar dehydrogenase [Magnetococcales bacterium]|nr:nucleotide sugar dehydrogenase [Magnetococcales bacterium]